MDVVIILFTAIIAYVIDGLGTRLTRQEADSRLFIKVLYYIKASPPADSEAIGEIFIA